MSSEIVKPDLEWRRLITEGLTVARATRRRTETFGQRLARLRRTAGLTQQQIADRTGVSRRMIAHYETRAARPPPHVLPKLAKALGVSVDELLGVTKSPGDQEATPRSTVDLRLWRKLQQIQRLSPQKRRAVIQVLDGFLAGVEVP
jgi:transcriptional regulator with XRE-family HTH domain